MKKLRLIKTVSYLVFCAVVAAAAAIVPAEQAQARPTPQQNAMINAAVGDINEVYRLAYEYGSVEALLWVSRSYAASGDIYRARLAHDNAHAYALDWAEYGWQWGKKGSDRDYGINMLREVADYTGPGADPTVSRLADNNHYRITSQNPPHVLHGPWVTTLGDASIEQYGGAFYGTIQLNGGIFRFHHVQSRPFDGITTVFWWTLHNAQGTLKGQGYAYTPYRFTGRLSHYFLFRFYIYDANTGTYLGPYRFEMNRP